MSILDSTLLDSSVASGIDMESANTLLAVCRPGLAAGDIDYLSTNLARHSLPLAQGHWPILHHSIPEFIFLDYKPNITPSQPFQCPYQISPMQLMLKLMVLHTQGAHFNLHSTFDTRPADELLNVK